ncbi:MAG: hypothetical protein RL732_184, partial [Bacteroidota bacterium]
QYKYSKIIAIRLNGGAVNDLTIFPNPFTTNVKLQLSAKQDAEATIRVSNAAGQAVLTQRVALQQGDNLIVISNGLEKLKPGLHILEVISVEGRYTQKLIKR